MTSVKEYKEIVMFDLDLLQDGFLLDDPERFNYHYDLLKGNLKDLFRKLKVV